MSFTFFHLLKCFVVVCLFFLLRIHRDKSFHCDVCNVCLDKRLQGKHKCRPDSGHDECCICLEVKYVLALGKVSRGTYFIFSRGLRPGSKACFENMNDWQYL